MNGGMKTANITIEGMSCGGCVAGVRKALERAEGVTVSEVQVGRAVVTIDPARSDEAALRRAIDAAGFDVRAVEIA